MLRLAVLLLVLANAGYFAWSQGFLAPWGFAAPQQTEPQRLAQQIKPQALRLVAGEEARRLEPVAVAQAPRPAECLQAGPFDEAQAGPLRQALAPWPAGSWSLEPVVEPPRGQLLKLASVDDALRPRLEELRAALDGRTLRPCR